MIRARIIPRGGVIGRLLVSLGLLGGPLTPGMARAERPPYRTVRSAEDWSRFERAPQDADSTDRLKNIRLGSVTSLSMGGQLRLRSESHRNPDFGLSPHAVHDLQLLRGLIHFDLRSRGGFRTFVELGTALAAGGERPERPIDENRLSVRQAFGEAAGLGAHGRLRLRVGRQELPLGSGRLVALRDGPNVRLSFDGVRLTVTHDRGTVDALGLTGVAAKPGVFDDFADPGEALWGLYSTTAVLGDGRLSIDAYYLGLRRERAAFGTDTGPEHRHSVGTRLFGARGPYDYNMELIGQAGAFARRPIAAWTVAADQGLSLRRAGITSRAGLRANVTSGGATGSRWLHTFNALYPNMAYFSQFALFSPANHVDLHPRLTIDVWGKLALEVASDWFWRTSLRDSIYAPPGVPIAAPEEFRGRYVGQELTTSASLRLGRHATLTGYYSRLWAGPAIRSRGGTDVDFLAFWLSILW